LESQNDANFQGDYFVKSDPLSPTQMMPFDSIVYMKNDSFEYSNYYRKENISSLKLYLENKKYTELFNGQIISSIESRDSFKYLKNSNTTVMAIFYPSILFLTKLYMLME
jgi:hypothetical protein